MEGVTKTYQFDSADQFWTAFNALNVESAHHYEDSELTESTGKLTITVIWLRDNAGVDYTEQPEGWDEFEYITE